MRMTLASVGEKGHPTPTRFARRPARLQGRVTKVLSRLRQRGFGFGEGPVEPGRQRFDVARLNGGAAPDAKPGGASR